MEYTTEGTHDIADLWGCSFSILNDEKRLTAYIKEAAAKAGATVLSVQSHRFDPQGVTVLAMLSESHMSIHTYPEKGFCGIDCYTCGASIDSGEAVAHLKACLAPSGMQRRLLKRGGGDIIESEGVS
ncbi:adenosylmethionine decarboxylase [Salibacterium lacus]|uniref:S-adenosylmethionine decarboxylase proenzyme n=1 Tax=Salibacterium lacus TaxID=1898109 RepID=A0ABW5T3U8_9BACI